MSQPKFRRMIRHINLYPPLLGMGIRVRSVNDDSTRFEVQLKSTWYNRNLFGTHFGGALYTMSDPFYVFIVILNLGRDYIVWDQSAAIRFLRPARGTITGVFEITPARLLEMRAKVDRLGKQAFTFETRLLDAAGEAVAEVTKTVHVRRKTPGA